VKQISLQKQHFSEILEGTSLLQSQRKKFFVEVVCSLECVGTFAMVADTHNIQQQQ